MTRIRTVTAPVVLVTTDGDSSWPLISSRAGIPTWSTRTAPVPAGQPVGACADGTSPVALDATVVDPAVFAAVTRTRSRAPTSLVETTYDCVVAPAVSAAMRA